MSPSEQNGRGDGREPKVTAGSKAGPPKLTSQKGWVRINYNKNIWIPCPIRFPKGYDRESWAAKFAQLWWDKSGIAHDDDAGVARLTATLKAIHENIWGTVPCHQAYINLPDPLLMPLAVYVGIWEQDGEREVQLRTMTHADDTGAVEPPIVDEFTTPALGAGLRTLLYKQQANGGLYAALCYAWRSEEYETDLRLWTACDDLGRLQRAIGDIDDFARAITVVPRSGLRRDR